MVSVFFRKQNAGRGPVGFGDHPELRSVTGVVSGEKPGAVDERLLVGVGVLGAEIAPVAGEVTGEDALDLGLGDLGENAWCRHDCRSS